MKEVRLQRDGYLFWGNQRTAPDEIVTLRLLGRRWVCGATHEAAEAVYDPRRVVRAGAVPEPIKATLFGKGGVQGLEGKSHLLRKQWFVDHLGPDDVATMRSEFTRLWRETLSENSRLSVFDEAARCLLRAALVWSGCSIPTDARSEASLCRDMVAMVDAIGSVGRRHVRGRLARKHAEHWAGRQISRGSTVAGSSLNSLRELSATGELSHHAARVELLNLLRPITAVAWYIAYAVLALHEHSDAHPAERDEASGLLWAQEVRRVYPFAPFAAGLATTPFTLGQRSVNIDDMVAVDIYGLHQNPSIWGDPHAFRPQRFEDGNTPAVPVPQGTGPLLESHRCPGEDLTLVLMSAAMAELANLEWYVPAQRFDIDLTRIPARIPSGMVIEMSRQG